MLEPISLRALAKVKLDIQKLYRTAHFVVDLRNRHIYGAGVKPDDTKLEDRITQLPVRERARLALRLLASLEPGPDEDVDELWLDEAEKRLQAFDEGLTNARDLEEVISEIEQQIK